jgi:hypothetical protein
LTIILHGLHLVNEIRAKVHAAGHSAALTIRRGPDRFGEAGSETDREARETRGGRMGRRDLWLKCLPRKSVSAKSARSTRLAPNGFSDFPVSTGWMRLSEPSHPD